MKHSKFFTSSVLATLLFASAGANAASYSDSQRIYPQNHVTSHKHVNKNHRQKTNIQGVNVARLEWRIKQGVKRGQLTHREARIARQGLKSLKATIRAVKQDRRVSNWERNRVRQKHAQLNRKITRLLNNRAVTKRATYSRYHARR